MSDRSEIEELVRRILNTECDDPSPPQQLVDTLANILTDVDQHIEHYMQDVIERRIEEPVEALPDVDLVTMPTPTTQH